MSPETLTAGRGQSTFVGSWTNQPRRRLRTQAVRNGRYSLQKHWGEPENGTRATKWTWIWLRCLFWPLQQRHSG